MIKEKDNIDLNFDDRPVDIDIFANRKSNIIIKNNNITNNEPKEIKELKPKQVGKTTNKRFRQFYLTNNILDQLDNFCSLNNYSKTDVVELALKEFLERNNK